MILLLYASILLLSVRIKFNKFLIALTLQLFLLEFLIFVHSYHQDLFAVSSFLLGLCKYLAQSLGRVFLVNKISFLFLLTRNLEAIFHEQKMILSNPMEKPQAGTFWPVKLPTILS